MSNEIERSHVREEYDELASEYDRRWRNYTERSLAETLRRIPPTPGASILDIGCGTGNLLRRLASRSPALLAGADISVGMLAVARRSLSERTLVTGGDALALPFRRTTFDVVVSSSSFHFWPDPVAALVEIRRVLRSGGTLVITDWCDDYLACRVCDVYLRLRNRAHRPAFSADEIRALIERSGFVIHSLDRYKISWIWGLMTVVATRAEQS